MAQLQVTFNVGLAEKIGLHEAMVLQKILYQHNNASTGHAYNAYKDCRDQFKFLSIASIQKAFLSLEKQGLLKRQGNSYQLHAKTADALLLDASDDSGSLSRIIKLWEEKIPNQTSRSAPVHQPVWNNNTTWTVPLVMEYCEEAPSTIRRLTIEKAERYLNALPGITPTGAEPMFMEAHPAQIILATQDEISRLEQVFEWLSHLKITERKLVWARADKTPWDTICWEYGYSRATAWRKWKYALGKVCNRLNSSNER